MNTNKMNRRVLPFLALLIMMGTFNSCQKEDQVDTVESEVTETEVSKFYIDGIEVSSTDYDAQSEDLDILQIHSSEVIDGVEVAVSEYRAFTTEDKYIAYGEANNLSFKDELAFESQMRTYAEESGAMSEFEDTGIMPQHYLDYERNLYDSYFGEANEAASKRAASVVMYDYYNGGGGQIVMIQTYPWMPGGWKDRVSCIEFVGLSGHVSLYRKTFYRRRIARILDTGFKKINLYGGANNRTRSAFKHF